MLRILVLLAALTALTAAPAGAQILPLPYRLPR